jgi:hypothetical protein
MHERLVAKPGRLAKTDRFRLTGICVTDLTVATL